MAASLKESTSPTRSSSRRHQFAQEDAPRRAPAHADPPSAASAQMEAPGAAHGGLPAAGGTDVPSPRRDGIFVGSIFCSYVPENTRNSLDIPPHVVKGDDDVEAERKTLEEENQQSAERNKESVLRDKETDSREPTGREHSRASLDQIFPALDVGDVRNQHLEDENKGLKDEIKRLKERIQKLMKDEEGFMAQILLQADFIECLIRR